MRSDTGHQLDPLADGSEVVVVGRGWLGAAVARDLGASVISRRKFNASHVPVGAVVVIASGRAWTPPNKSMTETLRSELDHLRLVLDACEASRARRIVVLGSSDVAGMSSLVDGRSPQNPNTAYGMIKSALEDECVLRRDAGAPITALRLAPVHGPGKSRTLKLIRMARSPLLPLPNGGHHSIGFVLLDDVLRGIAWLVSAPNPSPIVSIGGGDTPLRSLLRELGNAQERRAVAMRVPFPPRRILEAVCTPQLPSRAQWLVRLAVPRSVTMEPPVPVTPLDVAAKLLVLSVDPRH